jgi:hypothetical protein
MRRCERPGRPWTPVARILAACLLIASGCSDDGLPKRYPVTGTVTYNGKPLEKGQVNFLPTAPDGRPASGDIQAGEYSLTTQTPGDGAMPGKYRVTIVASDVDLNAAIAKQQGGIPSQEDVIKAQRKAKRLIPAKYEDPAKSGLEREVKEESNTFDFSLTD